MSALSKLILVTAALLLFLLIATPPAHAEVPPGFLDGLTDTDAAAGLFSGITGDIASGGTALMQLVSLSSYLAMIIASLMLIYLIAVGIINTARHGEFLGKSWHSSWTFMRPAVALALMLPMPTPSGLSVTQAAMIELPKFSVGIASAAWRWTVANIADDPIVRVPAVNDLSVAKSVLLAQVCEGDMRGWEEAMGNRDYPQPAQRIEGADGGKARVVIRYGQRGECGAASWLADSASAQTALDAYSALHNELAPIARDITSGARVMVDRQWVYRSIGSEADARRLIIAASQRFNDQLSSAAYTSAQSQYESAHADAIDDLKNGGWVSAGSYYYTLAQQQGAVSAAARGVVPAVAVPAGGIAPRIATDGQAKTIATRDALAVHGLLTATESDLNGRGGAIVQSSDSVISMIMSPTINAIRETIDSEGPPIMRIKMIGDMLNSAADTMLAAAAGSSAAAGALGWVPLLGSSLDASAEAIRDAAGYAVPILATLGFSFATAIPSLPYVMWIVGVAGFLLLVIEAIIAVPLALVMMAHPEGDDLLGRAEPIIGRIIEIFLRPLLMIVALVAGIAIFSLVVEVLDATYWRMMSGRLESGQSLLGYVGALVGYLVILTMLAMLSFSQVLSLPGRILEWLGTWGGRSGDLGEGEAQHTAGHAGAAAGRGVADAARTTTSGASAAAGGVGKKIGDATKNGINRIGGAKPNRGIDNIAGRG